MSKSLFSRRRFLKTSAVAAAPFILPSHVWSAETSANERLRLGFIGMGIQARGLMGGFMNRGQKDCEVVAVCDVDTTRREAAKKTATDYYAKQANASSYKGCEAYNDFRDLVARKDIDAVVIATPDHWHAIISNAAAKEGKDIYCEKPLCQTIGEARSMVDTVRKHKRVFQTGSMQRSSPEFRVACELVRNGVIGKVQTVDVMIGGPGVPCDLPAEDMEPGLDWNLWLGPAPERPYHSELSPRGIHRHFPNWRKYREYGGGMVTDWGAHHFDIAQWGLGMDDSGPVEILPAAQANAQEGVRLRYANGVEVTHKSGNGVWFYGTEGKVYVNRGKIEVWRGNEQLAKGREDIAKLEEEFLKNAKVRLYKSADHKTDWIEAIRSRKKPICDVEIGARSVSVCHLANLAYYHGQPIKWNPKSEKFTGGTGDKKWLNVDYRGGWKLA